MMDEFIPSPRHTPNKPRRMRDVSAIYPVNEKQLLLEAVMKQQRETPSADAPVNADLPAAMEESDPVGPQPVPPPSPTALWGDKRPSPVFHWPRGSSRSSSSGTSECEGGNSDASSRCKDCTGPHELAVSSSSSSSSSDDEGEGEDKEINTKVDLPDDGGIEEGEKEEEDDVDGGVVDDSDVKKNDGDKLPEQATHFFSEKEFDSMRKTAGFHKPLNRGHCLLGREVLTAPGKLLYGRHSVYYRETTIFRPQGRN